MKYYPNNTFKKFEFTTIKEWLKNECISPMGKQIADNLSPYSRFQTIERHLALTWELKELIEQYPNFPLDGYLHVSTFLNLLEKDGYTAQPEQITSVRRITQAIEEVIRFVESKEAEEVVLLRQLLKTIEFEERIITTIDKILTPEGTVRDRATDVLAVIRMEKKSAQRKLEAEFTKSLNRYRDLGYLADTQESIRHGRRVLSVKAEFKRKIKGVIHDISETGQTAYVEPNNALALSNEIINLEQEEKAEIHRILRQLSHDIRPWLPLVRDYEDMLGKIDFTRSKALVAQKLDGRVPDLKNEAVIDVINAYHPILKRQNEKADKPTEPLTIRLDKKTRIIVISGPNAGGKSVSLKTLGLLQIMLQSGIPVPVADGSTMGVFDKLFSEIGDDQSIENELSTYSSKLKHMTYFLDHVDASSLFLIDEFGSGTDPSLGGSVAQSILEELNNRKAFGVITTHYFNLKTFANNTKGIENAAMLFDENTLKPLYQLEVGKPGSSYTFAIAQTSGLPNKIVANAKQISNDEQVKLDDLLTDTQQSKSDIKIKQLELENRIRELEQKEDELKKLKKKVKKERSNYQINKKDEEMRIRAEVKKKFEQHVKKLETISNQQRGIDEIRASLKNELETTKNVLHDKIRKKEKRNGTKRKKAIEVGDDVKWIMNDQKGEVLEIKNKKAEVAIGSLKTTIPLKDLVLSSASKAEKKTRKKKGKRGSAGHRTSRNDEFDFSIDIRGKRYEEAELVLNDFFDRAILSNATWVKVLHGKGSGVLRKLTREVSQQYQPKEVSHPHPEDGGDGITIVKF